MDNPNKKETLIFLDHYSNVEPYRLLLEKDFNILFAGDVSSEVVKQVGDLKPDVLITDLRLAGKVENGYQVIRESKSVSPGTRIIVLTASEENPLYLIRSFEAGADGYLSRRITGVRLETVIRAVLQGVAVVTPKSILRKIMDISSKTIEYDEKFSRDNASLSEAELEVLGLVTQGLSNKEIATKLQKAEATIKGQLRSINQKLGTRSREEAVRVAITNNLLGGGTAWN